MCSISTVAVIARERLGLVKELCRINQNMRELDHFQDTMHGKDLTRFTDRAQDRLQHHKEVKQIHKYNFEPDPVEKMNLHLPLIKEEGTEAGSDGGDIAKVITAKDLNKHRVQLRKTNFEQCMADRRNRRRPFWDKAVIGSRKQQSLRDRNGFFRLHRGPGLFSGQGEPPVQPTNGNGRDERRKPRGPFKSPSLPSLTNLRKLDSDKMNAVHPSLSDRHSASMDYLPVIQGTRGQHLFFTSPKAPTLSSSALPTIAEV